MSYEKQTWETGQIITAEKLNHMEDGIAGARVPTLTVEITNSTELFKMGIFANGPYADGYIGMPLELASGATGTAKFLYSGDDEFGYSVVPLSDANLKIKSYTDNVNCTVEGVDTDNSYIKITDATKDASIKVVMDSTGGDQ